MFLENNYKKFYSLECEQVVLACLILYNYSWNDIYNFLIIEDFYFKNHKIIFSIILELLNSNIDFDINLVYNKLKYYKNFDFLNYLNFLIQKLPNPSNISFYACIIHNMFILRNIIFIMNKFLLNISSKEDLNLSLLLEEIELNIFNINKRYINKKNELITIENVINNYMNNNILENDVLSTGFRDLDIIFNGGINKGDLIIIAGRPSIGKTSFSLNLIKNISNFYNIPSIIFSMEMSANQLFIKILSSIIDKDRNIIINDLLKKNLDIDNILFNKICSMKIFIDESPNINILKIYSKCKSIIREQGAVGLILIDYLQLMSSFSINHSQNRVFEISEISRSLKCLAKELNIPIIAISQLNRNLELRNNKRPLISDLRESGSIEQDADVIIFIYKEENHNSIENKEKIEIIVGKHRNGPIGKIFLNFYNSKSRFTDF